MALLKLGIIATDARGSVAGTVFSRNKGGAYMRGRVAPLNPNSPRQAAVRQNFASNAKLWSGTLTDAERQAWTFFAQANPLVNILGASIIVSGLSMMMKLNQILLQIGEPIITTPPSDLNVDPIVDVTAVTVDHTSPAVTGTTLAQSALADTAYYVFASPPRAAGRKPGTSDYRFMARVDPVASATVVDITSQYQAAFGAFIAGQSVGILVSQVSITKGAVTPGFVFNAIST